MEHLLIYAYIVLIASVNFNFSYIFQGVNKVFNGLYRGCIESGVINFDNKGNAISPHFDFEYEFKMIRSYFKDNLTKYVKDYQLTLKFYNHENNLPNTKTPTEIDVYLVTDLAYIGEYKLSRSYYIGEGKSNG